MKDKKRMATKGRPDKWAFKNLKVMNFTEQESKIVMKHLYGVIVDLRNGITDINETMETLKGILVSINNLK